MPLYEYQCDTCGHRFEALQKFSDAPLEVCPKCGAAIRKLQSAPAFQLKGTGWYVTDFAKKDKTAAGPAGKSADVAGTPAKSGEDAGNATPAATSAPAAPAATESGSKPS